MKTGYEKKIINIVKVFLWDTPTFLIYKITNIDSFINRWFNDTTKKFLKNKNKGFWILLIIR